MTGTESTRDFAETMEKHWTNYMIKNFLLALALLLSVSLADAQSARWFNLNRGKAAHSFSFKDDGTLLYAGRSFNYRILVPDDNEQSFIPPDIWISSANPSGQYGILQASNRHHDFGYCWLLDLRHLTVTDINHTHYGPARWVMWSPDGRYAILEDPEAGILQRVELSSGQVVDLPVTCYINGLQDISPRDTRGYIDKMNQYQQINLQSFQWEPNNSKFTIKVDVGSYNQKGIDHSFSVEVDVPSGQARELPPTIDWGKFASSPARKALEKAERLTSYDAKVIFTGMRGDLSPDNGMLTGFFPTYSQAKNEFERNRLRQGIIDSLQRVYTELRSKQYCFDISESRLGGYDFSSKGFPFTSWTYPPGSDNPTLECSHGIGMATYSFANIQDGLLIGFVEEQKYRKYIGTDKLSGTVSVDQKTAEQFVDKYPDRKVMAYIVYRPTNAIASLVMFNPNGYNASFPVLEGTAMYFIITTLEGKVLGIYP